MNLTSLLTVTAALLAAGDSPWREIVPGLWRQATVPAAYVLVDGHQAIGIGAPAEIDLAGLEKLLDCRVETVLLTHHHRDSSAAAARLIREGRALRAPRASEPWLTQAGVRRHWDESILELPKDAAPPLFHRRWAKWQYLVLSEGIEGIACDLTDGDEIRCGKWTLTAVATPGHSPDHTSYLAVLNGRPERIVLCGDAFYEEGKLWTPYTTDWHHQNSDGLVAAAESLRKLATLGPTWLCPEHGKPRSERIDAQLAETAANLRRAAVAKSYADFLKGSGRETPDVEFLAPDQVGSATPDGNTKPWTKLSPHLFLSGNTYAIASREGPVLLIDPYHRGLVECLEELRRDHGIGPVEGMFVSHAHNDHYTGVFTWDVAERPAVWTLDQIAAVLEAPDRLRAPYVDPRPIPVARHLKDGETVAWREYRLKIHHQPGQTDFAMGVEAEIDGRRVLFTGDNFYRADQYSGSGGWSGHNRGLPGGYARSIGRILELKPDWILAEHGGAFAFSTDEFAARLAWAREAAAAADALSPSGDHQHDWNPHLARIEAVIVHTSAGEACQAALVAEGPLAAAKSLWIRLAENRVVADVQGASPLALQTGQAKLELKIRADTAPGRYVIPVEIGRPESPPLPVDCVLVIVVR